MSPWEKLSQGMKVTAGSRFNAADRLRRQDKYANATQAVVSAVLICLAISSFVFTVVQAHSKEISFSSLVVSIFLLVITLRKASNNDTVNAEQMHRCALEINELRRFGAALSEIEMSAEIKDITLKYNQIFQKWSINHTSEDFNKYKLQHRWEFEELKDISPASLDLKLFGSEFVNLSLEKVTLAATLAGLAAAVSSLLSLIG